MKESQSLFFKSMAQNLHEITLHVCLSPTIVRPEMLQQSAVAVIDVLRASTTICTALQHGAQAVKPFADVLDARDAFHTLTPQEQALVILGGERASVKPEGFHCGNSPFEYTAERVAGKTLFFTTTNGTAALAAALSAGATAVCVAAFVNAQVAAQWLIHQAWKLHCTAVTLICAGSAGDMSYEDTLCAGFMIHLLEKTHTDHAYNNSVYKPQQTAPLRRTDAATAAAELYALNAVQLSARLHTTQHGLSLAAMGFSNDITAALDINSRSIVPAMHNGILVAEHISPK